MIVIVFLMALAVAKPPDPPPYIGGKPVPQADRLRPADGDRLDPGLFDPFPEIRAPREIAPGQGIKPPGQELSVGARLLQFAANWGEVLAGLLLTLGAAVGAAIARYRKRLSEWWHPVKRGEFALLASRVEGLEKKNAELTKKADAANQAAQKARRALAEEGQRLQSELNTQLRATGEELLSALEQSGHVQVSRTQQAQRILDQSLTRAEQRFSDLVKR